MINDIVREYGSGISHLECAEILEKRLRAESYIVAADNLLRDLERHKEEYGTD